MLLCWILVSTAFADAQQPVASEAESLAISRTNRLFIDADSTSNVNAASAVLRRNIFPSETIVQVATAGTAVITQGVPGLAGYDSNCSMSCKQRRSLYRWHV